MAQSAKRFAELLQEDITAIADRTSKPNGVIRDKLGYAIDRKGSSVIALWGLWRSIFTPLTPSNDTDYALLLLGSLPTDRWLIAEL